MLKELNESLIFENLTGTNEKLKDKGYHNQLNPREINLFYLNDRTRKRIIREKDEWKELKGSKTWNWEEIKVEVENHPERFSPNAAFRPVYQELILPNLATIGGPGEIAYWLQLEDVFSVFNVDFPFLVLRNSHLFLTKKQENLINNNSLEIVNLLNKKEVLIKGVANGLLDIDISPESQAILEALEKISEKTIQLDTSLEGRIQGLKKTVDNGLSQLVSKLEKATKIKNEGTFKQLEKLYDSVTPNGRLNERSLNLFSLLNHMSLTEFTEKISSYDDDFTPKLFVHIV